MKHTVFLALAQQYANRNTGCTKVAVGSLIIDGTKNIISQGANRALPDLCRTERGCLRVEKYGENSKLHRNPDDCRAIHSEIDAIAKAKKSLAGCTIYVTRYPCEACARAIVQSGIIRVVYGRTTEISQLTYDIFEAGEVSVTWVKEWAAPDDIR